MKKRLLPIPLCPLLAALSVAVSCEQYALPRLEMDRDTLWAPQHGGIFEVVLSSNVRWSFDDGSIPSWIYLAPKYDSGGYQDKDFPLSVKVMENESAAERKCAMTVTTTTLSGALVVVQEGLPEDADGTESQTLEE